MKEGLFILMEVQGGVGGFHLMFQVLASPLASEWNYFHKEEDGISFTIRECNINLQIMPASCSSHSRPPTLSAVSSSSPSSSRRWALAFALSVTCSVVCCSCYFSICAAFAILDYHLSCSDGAVWHGFADLESIHWFCCKIHFTVLFFSLLLCFRLIY